MNDEHFSVLCSWIAAVAVALAFSLVVGAVVTAAVLGIRAIV